VGRSLRLRGDPRRELEAGVYVLAAILVGGLVLFAAINYGGQAHGYGAECVLTSTDALQRTLAESEKPVAVMFTSDTCPVCQQMEPYWSELCGRQDLPVEFVMFKLSQSTIQTFLDYGVTETPTFIVFVDGDPVARHVGGFAGENVTGIMLEWALASAGQASSAALRVLQDACSQCHVVPESLDRAALEEWMRANPDETLVRLLVTSVEAGISVSEMYGGTQGLAQVIMGMNQSISPADAYRIALLLDAMSASLRESGEASQVEASTAELDLGVAAGVGAALLAGLIAAFSPCVFPLLLAYLSALATRGGGGEELGTPAAVKAFAAAAAGTFVIGLAFLLLGDLATGVNQVLLPAAALVLVGAGVLGYMDVPTFVNIGVRSRRGLVGFSFIYGVLAVQCSLPLVASALMIVASGGLETGLPSLLAFTLGIAAPVGLAVYAVQHERLARAMQRLTSKDARRLTFLVLAFMGVILLLYSLGLI